MAKNCKICLNELAEGMDILRKSTDVIRVMDEGAYLTPPRKLVRR